MDQPGLPPTLIIISMDRDVKSDETFKRSVYTIEMRFHGIKKLPNLGILLTSYKKSKVRKFFRFQREFIIIFKWECP